MKLSKKIKLIALPIAATSLVAAPVFMATSCSKNYESHFFTVTNNKGLEVEFCDIGASIANLKVGNTYLTYHQKDRAAFINPERKPYWHGKLLGRVAGRFKDAEFKFNGEETKYKLQLNEVSATKNNTLHGGFDALSFKTFEHEVVQDTTATTVTFKYTSPDGEAGFPGELKITATYKIYKEENKIDTYLEATPNKKTLINLSTHSLFRLGNDGDILDYKLTMPHCTYRAEYDKEAEMKTGQIPVGKKNVTETDNHYYDFTSGKKIGEDIYASAFRDPVSNGYDHIWAVDDNTPVEERYVELYNPKNRINLKVQALEPKVTGFILYSNDYPNDSWIMSDGKPDTQYAGITIEPYTYFDSTDLSDITYEAGQTFKTGYSYIITQTN